VDSPVHLGCSLYRCDPPEGTHGNRERVHAGTEHECGRHIVCGPSQARHWTRCVAVSRWHWTGCVTDHPHVSTWIHLSGWMCMLRWFVGPVCSYLSRWIRIEPTNGEMWSWCDSTDRWILETRVPSAAPARCCNEADCIQAQASAHASSCIHPDRNSRTGDTCSPDGSPSGWPKQRRHRSV